MRFLDPQNNRFYSSLPNDPVIRRVKMCMWGCNNKQLWFSFLTGYHVKSVAKHIRTANREHLFVRKTNKLLHAWFRTRCI